MTFRVIQWATGAMGKTCLRAVLDHPDMELVGLYVYGQAKAGRDAGDIAKRPATGVLATTDVEEILALDADVVIHCARLAPPYGSHDVEILRLLESGKNVVSINGYSDPRFWRGERLAALEAACRKGGTSLMAAGLNPGFAAEQLAVVASGVCADVDAIEVVESVDCRAVRSPDYVFGVLGFGSEPARVDPNDPSWGPASSLNGMYCETLSALAKQLGLTLEQVDTEHRVFGASEELQVAAGTVLKGSVSHVNWRWVGRAEGGRRLVMSIHWYLEPAHLDEADPPLWRVKVDGRPGVRIAVDLEKHPQDASPTTAEQWAVAGSVINAIPVVCAAEPGPLMRPLATPFRLDPARRAAAA